MEKDNSSDFAPSGYYGKRTGEKTKYNKTGLRNTDKKKNKRNLKEQMDIEAKDACKRMLEREQELNKPSTTIDGIVYHRRLKKLE